MTKKEDEELRQFYKNIPMEEIHRSIFNFKPPSKKRHPKFTYRDPSTDRLMYLS